MLEQNPLDHLVAIQQIAIFFRVSLWNQPEKHGSNAMDQRHGMGRNWVILQVNMADNGWDPEANEGF